MRARLRARGARPSEDLRPGVDEEAPRRHAQGAPAEDLGVRDPDYVPDLRGHGPQAAQADRRRRAVVTLERASDNLAGHVLVRDEAQVVLDARRRRGWGASPTERPTTLHRRRVEPRAVVVSGAGRVHGGRQGAVVRDTNVQDLLLRDGTLPPVLLQVAQRDHGELPAALRPGQTAHAREALEDVLKGRLFVEQEVVGAEGGVLLEPLQHGQDVDQARRHLPGDLGNAGVKAPVAAGGARVGR